MTQEEMQKALEFIGKSGINVAGDLVLKKEVQYEVNNVEDGGIGIQINHGVEAEASKEANKEGTAENSLLPDILATEQAMKYWSLLQKNGFVDKDNQLLPETTRKQAMYIADMFSEKLQLRLKWKPFQEFWHINNLAQEKWDMQESGKVPVRSDEIDRIFER